MPVIWEERIASLIAGLGLVWCVRGATQNFTSLDKLHVPQDAMYVVGLGVVFWLHGKWRRSTDISRA
jgi:hypothetical protein